MPTVPHSPPFPSLSLPFLLAVCCHTSHSQVVLDAWQLVAVVLSADLLLNLPDSNARGLSGLIITQHTIWQWVPFDCLMGHYSTASGAAVQTLLAVALPCEECTHACMHMQGDCGTHA